MKLDSPFLFTILFGILTFVIVPFLPTTRKGVAALVFVLLNAVISSVSAVNVLLGHTIALTLQGGSVFGDIPLRIDPLAAWFILIVNFTCVNGALYGIGYLKPYVEQRKNPCTGVCLWFSTRRCFGSALFSTAWRS
jgi:NADH:ubiquinone oxidoreductase subunit 5 (subunit L)/multisubunit Na+/H+ antiporter MnhA subunit